MRENNSIGHNKIGVIKFIIFTLVIGTFAAVGLSNNQTKVKIDADTLLALEQARAERSKESRITLLESLDKGSKKLKNSDKLMSNVDANGQPVITPEGVIETSPVTCPQYLLPEMPPLPTLPKSEVMATVTRDQLNFILYQHIKAHQERTIEVRKRINDSYSTYIATCN